MTRRTYAGIAAIALALVLIPAFVIPQVLGPCGAPAKKGGAAPAAVSASASAPAPAQPAGLVVSPVPLPGQRAIDFELPAVVGSDMKTVKLSDYQGKWRVLCFFPAAFTFV